MKPASEQIKSDTYSCIFYEDAGEALKGRESWRAMHEAQMLTVAAYTVKVTENPNDLHFRARYQHSIRNERNYNAALEMQAQTCTVEHLKALAKDAFCAVQAIKDYIKRRQDVMENVLNDTDPSCITVMLDTCATCMQIACDEATVVAKEADGKLKRQLELARQERARSVKPRVQA